MPPVHHQVTTQIDGVPSLKIYFHRDLTSTTDSLKTMVLFDVGKIS